MMWAEFKTQSGENLNLEGVTAKGVIQGRMLEMTLEQRFRNPEDANVEVLYTFPLPWGAMLTGIDVVLNGERLTGVVTAKQQARETYEMALSEGNTSILLSRNHDQSYTLELGNLLAKEVCVVTMRYAQVLQPEQEALRMSLPTTMAPRYGDAVQDGKFELHAAPVMNSCAEYPFDIKLAIHGSLASAVVSSPTHPVTVQHVDGQTHVSLGRSSWLDRDFVLVLGDLKETSIAIAARDAAEQGMATVMASFTPQFDAGEPRAATVKLLVDCSGSMAGDSIDAARRALYSIVDSLRSEDWFSLSKFGNETRHRSRAMWAGGAAAKASAKRWVDGVNADLGGTEMNQALISTIALKSSRPADVLLITDGEIHAIDDVLVTAKVAGQRIFVVGIGASSAEAHLRRIANETGGVCEFVAPGEQVAPAVIRMFNRLRAPALSNLRLQWPNGCSPKTLVGLPMFAFNGDTVTAYAQVSAEELSEGEVQLIGTLQGKQAAQPIASTGVTWIEDTQNTMARLAAESRYKDLTQSENQPDSIEGILAALGEKYQLITEHTHLVMVHERAEAQRPQEMPELRQVASMMAAGWSGQGSVKSSVAFSAMQVASPVAHYHGLAVPSVWRTNRTQAAARIDGDVGMDDFDIPAFLRKKADDTSPVPNQAQRQIHVTHVDRKRVEFWAAESALFSGLTPAGLLEFLAANDESFWPRSFKDLEKIGVGPEVQDWLEFEGGAGQDEQAVLQALWRALLSLADQADDAKVGSLPRHLEELIRKSDAWSTSFGVTSSSIGHLPINNLSMAAWPEEMVTFQMAERSGL